MGRNRVVDYANVKKLMGEKPNLTLKEACIELGLGPNTHWYYLKTADEKKTGGVPNKRDVIADYHKVKALMDEKNIGVLKASKMLNIEQNTGWYYAARRRFELSTNEVVPITPTQLKQIHKRQKREPTLVNIPIPAMVKKPVTILMGDPDEISKLLDKASRIQ